jgi:kelch-like protein 17 (actinfilin)/kelch-like protein 20
VGYCWLLGAACLVVVNGCGRIGFDATKQGATGIDASYINVPHCQDALRDGDETGIDCGGSCGVACPGATCTGSAACVTGSCVSGFCELASGPPSWLGGPPLTTARAYLQSAVDGSGAILAVGGTTTGSPTGAVTTVEVLAPGSAAWTSAPSLITARSYHAVAAANGTVFAYGGYSTSGAGLMSIERYAGTWSTGTASSFGTAGAYAAAGTDGRLYVVDNSATKIYTPALDSWSTSPTPATALQQTGVTLGPDGPIYAIGGNSSATCVPSCVLVASVDALDTQTLTWTSRAALPTARFYVGAVSAPDGRIYAIGGNSGPTINTVDAYTPSADRWTAAASLTQARAAFGGSIAADGRIYAIGGASPTGTALGSVEVYGPVLTLDRYAATAGTTVAVAAANFAANAPIGVTFDGTLIAAATTSATGNAVLSFVVPALAAGAHSVVAVDDKSQYAVQASFQIQ